MVLAGIERSPKIFDFRASGIPVQKRVDFFDTHKRQDILPLVPLPLVCLSLIGYRLFCLHGIGAVYELDIAVHFIGNAGE